MTLLQILVRGLVTLLLSVVLMAGWPHLAQAAPEPMPTSEAAEPSIVAQGATILLCQTPSYQARIYRQGTQTLLDAASREAGMQWLTGIPVRVTVTPEGTQYRTTRGETSVEVTQFRSNETCQIKVGDGPAETSG